LSDQQITLSQLEGHLWESANILRGPVDAADFKTYIFPLLFFKRICDVWDEEYQEIVDETGDEQLAWFPESHRFQIPEDCHWNDVHIKARNIGAALQRAMREIEKANPDTLYGVFGDAQWSNKERLSDALVKDLIEHFSKLPLGNKNVNSDLLGDAYEYLIKKFAELRQKLLPKPGNVIRQIGRNPHDVVPMPRPNHFEPLAPVPIAATQQRLQLGQLVLKNV
jgi:type I restriction enzyme M protein